MCVFMFPILIMLLQTAHFSLPQLLPGQESGAEVLSRFEDLAEGRKAGRDASLLPGSLPLACF